MKTQNVTPMIIGHRGAPGIRLEHTASAYKEAIKHNVDAVEPDLVLSKDGVLVIRHENEISTTTNVAEKEEFADRYTTKMVDGKKISGWFTEDFTWKELQTLHCKERLPEIRPQNISFDGKEEILDLANLIKVLDSQETTKMRKTQLVLELKHVTYYERLGFNYLQIFLTEIRRLQLEKTRQLIIESFELTPLLELKKVGIKADMVFLLEDLGAPAEEMLSDCADIKTYSWYRSKAGLKYLSKKIAGVSFNKKNLFHYDETGNITGCNTIVASAKSLGLKVFVWTLRPENCFLNKVFRKGNNLFEYGDWRKELDLILNTGVTGIFVDFPHLVRPLL